MMNKAGLILAASLLLSACASVPMAEKAADDHAKKFQVEKGKGRIYVYRDESLGSAVKVALTLDGRAMGQSAPNVYFAWDVTPGKHQLSCMSENTGSVDVEVPKGKSVYVWQEMKMGWWSARCALHEVAEDKGQAAVRTCKLAL